MESPSGGSSDVPAPDGHDIGQPTPSAQSSAALRESEERFRLLIESFKDFAIVTLDPQGLIATWNDGAARIKGWTAEEVVGHSYEVFFPSNDVAAGRPARLLEEARARGRIEEEAWRVRKDGSAFMADAVLTAVTNNGQLCGFVKVTRDITEQRLAMERLQESERRFRAALDASLDTFALFKAVRDPASRAIVDFLYAEVNGKAERTLNRPRETLVGMRLSEVIPAAIQQGLFDMLVTVVSTGQPLESEQRIAYPEAAVEWVQRQVVPVGDGAAVMSRDITVLKNVEKHLRDVIEKLQRSNDELQMFAYVASHDLQEPLRMVASYVQLLEKRFKGQLGDDADKYIAYAVDGALRMRSLINDLLAYSRVDSHGKPPELVEPRPIVETALRDLTASIDDTGAVVEIGDLPAVEADSSQLRQLFQNLIGNAIKFHRTGAHPRVRVFGERRPGECVFAVQDDGIGIDPQYFDRIFRPFQRLHGRTEYAGTGIGLSISKKIVERHGGRIWVDSQPDQGATFFFSLPRGRRTT